MKKKLKKGIVLMLMGVMLFCGVLTAYAVTPRTCTNHTPQEENHHNEVFMEGSHILDNGEKCNLSRVYRVYDIICTKCRVTLGEGKIPLGEQRHDNSRCPNY